MLKKFMALAALSIGLSSSASFAATCGGDYTIKPGDSLSQIAQNLYEDKNKWSVIYNSNSDVIGDQPGMIFAGTVLHITCIDGKPTGLAGGVDVSTVEESAPITTVPGTAANKKKIGIVTADDYKPFTDRSLPNGGMLAGVMNAAMKAANPPEGFEIYWVNDWSSHLDPLLSNALIDLGIPWFKPACDVTPDAYRCQNFHFSDPLFEMLILLFTNKDNPIPFAQDSDIVGKTLCRPAGYFTHDLDKNGRNWMKDGKITLKTPVAVKDCFDMLVAGEVDAVALNEFTGRTALKDLGLKDKVIAIDSRPLSVEALHAVVHKSHPRAEELLAMVNNGLREIRASGEYQKIIDEHLALVWANF